MSKLNAAEIPSVVSRALADQSVVDMHTHLYPPSFGTPVPHAGGKTDPAGLIFGVFGLVMLGLLIPSIAVTFRRLHDTNRSAWWLLIGLVPFLGALVLLVFYFLDGTPGPNKFGPDPKGRGAAEVFA